MNSEGMTVYFSSMPPRGRPHLYPVMTRPLIEHCFLKNVNNFVIHFCLLASVWLTAVAVGDDLMPLVEGDFPFLQLSPSMMRVLWSRQMAQIRALTAQGVASRSRGVCNRVSEIERRQQALLGIINKEVQHTKRMVRVHVLYCS